ncbi:MAG TPA: dihydrodipicolinate reductase C-terminal domain-containing protein [Bacteroidales bacterium]|nr:dihydrodipicolinate reductase C-terminal domain-containing protein [Bacteroidales bacterium]
MRIALLGYGRMGREIESAAAAGGHTVVVRTDIDNPGDFNSSTASGCDVAIEFSGPEAAADNIIRALSLGVPVVSGSTGWLARYDEVVGVCTKKNGSFIHSSNYSIGVNILFRLNAEMTRMMNLLPGYSPSIDEIHHVKKLDAPSGTAITLAGDIARLHHTYNGWQKADEKADPEKIPVSSVREGTVPGIHSVTWRSDADIITLKHEALSRKGFASGALLAAAYISTRKGVFTMADVLSL